MNIFGYAVCVTFRFPTWALNFGATSIVIVIIVGILGNALTIGKLTTFHLQFQKPCFSHVSVFFVLVALTRCQRVRNVATAFIIRFVVKIKKLVF